MHAWAEWVCVRSHAVHPFNKPHSGWRNCSMYEKFACFVCTENQTDPERNSCFLFSMLIIYCATHVGSPDFTGYGAATLAAFSLPSICTSSKFFFRTRVSSLGGASSLRGCLSSWFSGERCASFSARFGFETWSSEPVWNGLLFYSFIETMVVVLWKHTSRFNN